MSGIWEYNPKSRKWRRISLPPDERAGKVWLAAFKKNHPRTKFLLQEERPGCPRVDGRGPADLRYIKWQYPVT